MCVCVCVCVCECTCLHKSITEESEQYIVSGLNGETAQYSGQKGMFTEAKYTIVLQN